MDERFESSSSGIETKEITKLDENILGQVLHIWESIYDNICWPIAYKIERTPEVDPGGLKQKIINFVNHNHQLLTKYKMEDPKGYSYNVFSDFQTYLTKLLEVFKDYGEFDGLTEDYKHSPMVHKLVEGMFEVNREFYNLYMGLKRDSLLANAGAVQYSPSVDGWDREYVYINTEQGDRINKIYDKNIAKIKEVWMVVYRLLLQLVKKELEALIKENGEERFKAGLNNSYIGKFIKVESGKNFSRSYFILIDKLRGLEKNRAEMQECSGEVGDLKNSERIRNLEMGDLGAYLKIKRSDKFKYNTREIINSIKDCISGTRKGNKM